MIRAAAGVNMSRVPSLVSIASAEVGMKINYVFKINSFVLFYF